MKDLNRELETLIKDLNSVDKRTDDLFIRYFEKEEAMQEKLEALKRLTSCRQKSMKLSQTGWLKRLADLRENCHFAISHETPEVEARRSKHGGRSTRGRSTSQRSKQHARPQRSRKGEEGKSTEIYP